MENRIIQKTLAFENKYIQSNRPNAYLFDPEYKNYFEVNSSYLSEVAMDLCVDIEKPNISFSKDFEENYSYYDGNNIIRFFKEKDKDAIEFFYGACKYASYFGNDSNFFSGEFHRIVKKYIQHWGLTDIYKLLEFKNTVFVAISFSDEMKKAREKIKEAIMQFNYLPILIDERQHSFMIAEEISYQISECKFVIADFTENRGGVYYEAGIGKGLKKPVIHTCKNNDLQKENIHFDVRQNNFIFWDNEMDLYNRLITRIEATIEIGKGEIS